MTKMLQTIWIDECKVRCKGSTFDVKWDSECEDSSSVKTPGDKALLSKNPKPKPRFVDTTYIDLYWLFKISESSSNTIQHNLLFHGFSLVFFFISSQGPRHRHATPWPPMWPAAVAPWRRGVAELWRARPSAPPKPSTRWPRAAATSDAPVSHGRTLRKAVWKP